MITVILAAGKSERFSRYGMPKAALPGPDKKKTVLEYVIDSIEPIFCMVVYSKDHKTTMRKTIMNISQRKGSKDWLRLLWHVMVEKTSGPLDTAYKAISALKYQDTDILISYCDVILPASITHEFVEKCRAGGYDAGIAVFDSEDRRFQRNILGTCNSGLFWFRSRDQFCELAESLPKDDINGIPDVVFSLDNIFPINVTESVIDIGVPEDYERWIA